MTPLMYPAAPVTRMFTDDRTSWVAEVILIEKPALTLNSSGCSLRLWKSQGQLTSLALFCPGDQ